MVILLYGFMTPVHGGGENNIIISKEAGTITAKCTDGMDNSAMIAGDKIEIIGHLITKPSGGKLSGSSKSIDDSNGNSATDIELTPANSVTFKSQKKDFTGFDIEEYTYATDSVADGGKVAKPSDPSAPVSGWTFGGWYKEKTYTNAWDFDKDTVNSDITLYAKWIYETYTVSFNMMGHGNAIPQATVKQGLTIFQPDPTATGYTFGGWFKEEACSNRWDYQSDVVTSNMTLYAKWTPNTYTVTYDKNKPVSAEGNVAGTTANSTHTYDTPKNLTKNGYTLVSYNFNGWNTKADGSGTPYADEQSVKNLSSTKNATVTLYAQWIPEGATIYTVSFNMNGHGEAITSQKVVEGAKVPRPADPSAEGFTFDGWYKEPGCTNAWNFDIDTVTKDTTLYAKWTGDKPDPTPTPTPDPTPKPTPTPTPEPVVYGFTAAFDKTAVSVNEAGEALLTYTGSAQKPAVIVKNNGKLLCEGTDYTVKYTGNKDFSEAGGKAIVTGKGAYSGTRELKLLITKKKLSDAEITVGSTIVEKGKTANPVVMYGGAALKKGTDYTAGSVTDGKLTLTGAGNFDGTREVAVIELESKEYKKTAIKVTAKKVSRVYDGQPQTLTDSELVVKNADGKVLAKGTDYAVSYSANVNAGTVKYVVTGLNGYSGSSKKTFKITPAANAAFEVKKDKSEYDFVKSGVKPQFTVKAVLQGGRSETLTEGRDFNVTYSDNKKTGTGKAKLTFKGNFKGAKYKGSDTDFMIVPAKMTAENTVIVASDMVYNKSAKYQPVPVVTVNGETLAGTDFTRTYSETGKLTLEKGEIKICTLTVKVKTGNKAKYTDGTGGAGVTVSYRVISGSEKKDIRKAKVSVVQKGRTLKSVAYTGLPLTFDDLENADAAKLSMKIGSETLDAKAIADSFDITYADNTEKGKGKVMLSAKPDSKYIGAVTGTFKISSMVIGSAKK